MIQQPHSTALLLSLAASLVACSSSSSSMSKLGTISATKIETRDFGKTVDGDPATLFVLRNSNGTEAHLTDFGATLVAFQVRDRAGNLDDVVLGFDDVNGYESDENQYFGCTAGRVANRIRFGKFRIGGREFNLATNNPPNHLHGGDRGFGQYLWAAAPSGQQASVTFTLESPAGNEGYPGKLVASVTYSLTDRDELVVDYKATTDAATPVNLTHHSYFNLAGAGSPTVLDHVLQVNAANYTPTDDTLIPTGEIAPVEGTPLDFRAPTRIGDRIATLDETPALGYDHNYAVRDASLPPTYDAVLSAGPVAVLKDPGSGRVLELFSDQPGLQFYSGNFLMGQAGKGDVEYAHRSACCLETQGYPNAINQKEFPSVLLEPGREYRQLTVHRFRAE